jgi:alpha-tubulin suppressor-like RCC1 family protein
MKMITGSTRRHYLARVNTFLIALGFIAGMVACGGGVIEYDLTITSTSGGSVTAPGEGTFAYGEGEVVNLAATPDAGYQFANWTGDVSTIADVNAATTTITMNVDYSIMANFAVAYNLSITSIARGSVTTPGEGTHTYSSGTVVDLMATPDPGYQFEHWSGDVGTVADIHDPTTTIAVNGDYSIEAYFRLYCPKISAGDWHTVGVKTNGTVVAVGYNGDGRCNIDTWIDITQIAAGYGHTAGVRIDYTGAVVVGDNTYGQLNVVSGPTLYVAAGPYHTVAINGIGGLGAWGRNDEGQCNVSTWLEGLMWPDVIRVAGGFAHSVGLKEDGTVVATGAVGYDYGQCNVSGWTDIVQVAAGYAHTVGLRDDGTLVAAGRNQHGQCNVTGWMDIIQVAAGEYHTVGLKDDGTVVATGYNDYGQCDVTDWADIVQVAAGKYHTVGLKDDGTVLAVGWNLYGQCSVTGWDLTP